MITMRIIYLGLLAWELSATDQRKQVTEYLSQGIFDQVLWQFEMPGMISISEIGSDIVENL